MNNFINTTGYLNNSPHRFNPMNIIPGGDITMNGVNIPLLLRPNKGKSKIALPNSGSYKFPKADYVTELPLMQKGGTNYLNDCPEGYEWSVADQNCLPVDQVQASNFRGNSNKFIMNTGTGFPMQQQGNQPFTNQNGDMNLKRVFGTPNIPAIMAGNLLGFGLSVFAHNAEQGRQRAFAMKQMNDPSFNQTFSNAQNDYGIDPYEQTGQLRPTYQQGGRVPIQVTNPNDPRLRAYNDSLALYNAGQRGKKYALNGKPSYKEWKNFIENDPTSEERASYRRLNNPKPIQEPFFNLSDAKNAQYKIYQKPVQPVVYQKQGSAFDINPPLQGADTNMTPWGKRIVDLPRNANPNDYEKKYYSVKGNGMFTFVKKTPVIPPINKTDIPIEQQQLMSRARTTPGIEQFVRPEFQQKKTPFSFNYHGGQGDRDQRSIYFNTKKELKDFIEKNAQQIGASGDVNDNNNPYTVAGNLKKYQQGGRLNIFEYLYGDDEEDNQQTDAKSNKAASQKRVVVDDVNQEQLDLQAAGLTGEDILNMNSPVKSQRPRYNYNNDSGTVNTDSATSGNYLTYLRHQQGEAGIGAILKAAQEGLPSVPRNWNRENIQANMRNNVGKDFKGELTPASFLNYWNNKFDSNMKAVANKQTPYDEVFQRVGQEEGIDPLLLKTIANIESGLNPKNNTKSKYKGLFAMNSKTFRGNIFDPYQNSKAAAKNLKQYQQGGTYSVDFNTLRELQEKGIKFKIVE